MKGLKGTIKIIDDVEAKLQWKNRCYHPMAFCRGEEGGKTLGFRGLEIFQNLVKFS